MVSVFQRKVVRGTGFNKEGSIWAISFMETLSM